jgi:hypothetical protein
MGLRWLEIDIIPVFMLVHLSHLLRPLHIGCFAVLKRSYGQLEIKMRTGINHIDKLNFLGAYPHVRIESFRPVAIKNSFAAAGLVLYDSDWVIPKLNIRLRTTTSPSSRGSDWESKMPSNYMQIQKQVSSIKALLRIRSGSPSSPLDSAINQVLEACQITTQSAAILEKEVSDLRAASEKQKQKWRRPKRRVPHEDGFSVSEAREPIGAPCELR